MRARTLLVTASLIVFGGAPVAGGADPLPIVTAAGFTVTIDAPETYVPDEPFTVSGSLTVAFALPIIVEVGEGIPDEEIVVRVDGVAAATAVTDDEGRYEVALTFDGLPPTTRTLTATAYEGELLHTRSDEITIRQDRILSELSVSPQSLQMTVGDAEQLTATAMWDDGRTTDETTRVVWATSDPAVATVSADGVVDAADLGDATITGTLRDKQVTVTVTVA